MNTSNIPKWANSPIIGVLMTLLAGTAIGEEVPTLALSKISGGNSSGLYVQAHRKAEKIYTVDFLPYGESVAALNFDVTVDGNAKLSLERCGGESASYEAMCRMVAKDTLRVLIFTAPTAAIAADSVVQFAVSGGKGAVNIDAQSVSVNDLKGQPLRTSVL